MDLPNWLIGLGVLAALALVGGSAMLFFARCFPEPEGNRPSPPGLIAANEQARIAALHKVADRQRLLKQREASSRISRGF